MRRPEEFIGLPMADEREPAALFLREEKAVLDSRQRLRG
jgi:hypothetical protein